MDQKLMISEKNGKYLLIVANTDNFSRGGINWWSMLYIEPFFFFFFFFDSFGLDGKIYYS